MIDSDTNYRETIAVSASAEDSFNAVTREMDLWWTKTTEGALEKTGDTVKVIFPPKFGFWTFQARTMEPGRRIEMECVDAHHKVDGQPAEIDKEWVGTRIIWDFLDKGDKTEVTMTHHGLTPKLHCWDICFDGWNFFFKDSLKKYLNGEAAAPHGV